MPSEEQSSRAVFQSVKDGTYPEDEQVISAELSSTALNNLSELLEQARTDVKKSISELSRLSASDINGWIAQAKQLKSDIDDSQHQSDEIVRAASQGQGLRDKAQDAASKVGLLKKEVAFNDSLISILQEVQTLKRNLNAAQDAVLGSRLLDAISLLKESKTQLSSLRERHTSRAIDLIKTKITDLENHVADILTESWAALIYVDLSVPSITINNDSDGIAVANLDTVVKGLESLDLINGKILAFGRILDQVIIAPRLSEQSDSIRAILVQGRTVRVLGRLVDKSIEKLFSDVRAIVEFLDSYLPQSVVRSLSEELMTSLVSRLLNGPLVLSVPPDLDGIPTFQTTLQNVLGFVKFLKSRSWRGQQDLIKWTENAPKVWLARRSESSLHSIRQLLKRGLGNPRAVERVEIQMVTRRDEMFTGSGNQDEWDAGWSDDGDGGGSETARVDKTRPTSREEDEEEDTSAWGFDDDPEEEKGDIVSHTDADATANADDGGEAWGWGDDDNVNPSTSPNHLTTANYKASQSNGHGMQASPHKRSEREYTLRETYHITALPEQILEIIIQAVDDAEYLGRPTNSSNPVASASKGMFSLCGLLLSMFRASAPNFYAHNVNGNMFLYNDCLYMAEQLRLYSQHHKSKSQGQSNKSNLDLEPDIAALELFGKRAYGKEMELQRTILSDLLDGAQGFANCTEHPFAQECDLAISSTVDRLRDVHRQWKPVLSRSALLQSIGSLLATATNKMIVDIEDMSDIPEPESQRLTAFCNRITALDDLFLPEPTADAKPDDQVISLTAVYTSTWLKFQFLSNILESSLVDIKYLWIEAELSLEFSADEVIDLIKALFADSEYRRKAIAEIRRGARG